MRTLHATNLKQIGTSHSGKKPHVESFLRGNGDDEVWKELKKRKLTEEERSWMEGSITKLEMRHQLFQHMKPNSAHGIDGFTVSYLQ